ncbi:hypothetical protein A3K93_09410 [Acinetobacter sp. NCu2D-2]|uniref:DUF4041 domain-containing protein n=1 Tax=Acinetobacter sp. NCu2D-2 TaxID=1608473 RepID=UPI0007CDB972|nr:DUF4041 domain-containing protein [Acinetobacter sp. NCu2D-2]ANF82390.1 hypothetical protein A3K93_09410 [Acinetobacter sp. NCu2D-2]
MWMIAVFALAIALILQFLYSIQVRKQLRTNIRSLQENLDHSRAKLAEYETQTHDLNYELTQLRVQVSSLKTDLNKYLKYQDICDIEQYIISRTLQAENFVEMTKVDASIMIEDIKAYIERVKDYINRYQKQALQNVDEQAREKLKGYFKQAEEQQRLSEVITALEHKIQGYPTTLNYSADHFMQQLIDDFNQHDAVKRLTDIRERIEQAKQQGQIATCNYVDDSRRNTTVELIGMAFNSKADLYLQQLTADNLGELLQALRDDYVLINFKGTDLSQAHILESYLELRLEELKFAAVLKQLERTQVRDEQMG